METKENQTEVWERNQIQILRQVDSDGDTHCNHLLTFCAFQFHDTWTEKWADLRTGGPLKGEKAEHKSALEVLILKIFKKIQTSVSSLELHNLSK